MSENYLERSKTAWVRASGFPADKEAVYPDHSIVQEFDSHSGKLVYEYGIGGGSDLISYLRRGNRVWGTDIVPENLRVSRDRILKAGFKEENFNLILLGDSYPLPFEDNFFDVVSSHGVLHHIIDPYPVVEEFYRILKPGGLCYVMLYTHEMEDYFNEMGLIEKFMKENNLSYDEAFGWCTDNTGTPYSRSYDVTQTNALFIGFGFKLEDYTYWLNDHFCTYKFRKG